MDNGLQNGIHTNYDRDASRVNGVNGGFIKSEPGLDKGKPGPDKGKEVNSSAINGNYLGSDHIHDSKTNTMSADNGMQNGTVQTVAGAGTGASAMMKSMRLEELPDEIQHITTGIFPLGLLLFRLSQMTYNHLGDLIDALAELPIPIAPNGVSESRPTGVPPEDTNPVSLEKKRRILDFIQGEHNKWVKALVLTEWSRKSDQVRMLIDLKGHLEQQLNRYGLALTDLINVKRELVFARVPPPDHKTALHVLSYGDVDWMPDFGYIEPPPVDPDEELELMESLNTLLDARLTLEDFDRIPYHFRDYVVEAGRATFRVAGEFEVDLTIADEDFDKQYWFLDFRFTFNPAPEELTEAMRNFLDVKVNDILATEGLSGCYNFLHEFTLTHKITEIRRQALDLAKTRWVGSLMVEPLNRALSIQYWLPRPVAAQQTGPQNSGSQAVLKSWFIVGVHSGRKTGAAHQDPAAASYLKVRWFRDGKEVKDVDLPLETADISAENILKMVVGRHIEHILTSIYNKLTSFPRYKHREAPLRLTISKEEPSESQLVMQLSQKQTMVVKIDPMTGLFAVNPVARALSACERALNTSRRNPAEDGYNLLERARWHYSMEELTRHGRSLGWEAQPLRVRPEELKPFIKTRDMYQPLWIRHVGWKPGWHVLVTMGLAGDRWWLVQITGDPKDANGPRIKSFTAIPLTGPPSISDDFFHHLKIFTTGMISQLVDMHLLQERGIRHMELPQPSQSLPRQVKLPAVFIRLSELVPSVAPVQPRHNWAFDYVQLTFQGVQQSMDAEDAAHPMAAVGSLLAVQEATIRVADKTKFKDLKGGSVDSDVTFNSRLGQFSLRLQQQVGMSLIDTLATRVQAICRLVDFVDAMRKSGDDIVCESVTMREVVLSYGNELLGYESAMLQHQPRWILRLDLASGPRIKVSLDNGNPHLRILDHLEDMANSPLLSELPAVLKSTYALLQALEEIEQTWQRIAENADGSIEISHWSANSTSMRYTLAGGRPNQPRQAVLDIRRGEKLDGQWWILELRGAETTAPTQHNEFLKVLKPLFDSRGEQWKGLGTGAAAATGKGTHTLLLAVNTAVMNLVGSPPPPPLPPAATAAPDPSSAPAASAQIPTPQSIPMFKQRSQQQRPQQQPAPQKNHVGQARSSNNNNHNSNQNHEVVIID